MPINKRTLVLNSDYRPLGIISWKRAIVLSILHDQNPNTGVQIVDSFPSDYIQTLYQRYPVPSVVRSIIYVKQKKDTIPFSRKNVFIRDQLTCLYCGKQFKPEDLEYDHVIPRSKWDIKWGSPTNWINIVTCCKKCNRYKANRTPQEAKMKLLKEPKSPNPYNYVLGISPWSNIPEQWIPYLPPIYTALIKKYNNLKESGV
jgi:5-methylcytosine-specific restriction endonuclease McrA